MKIFWGFTFLAGAWIFLIAGSTTMWAISLGASIVYMTLGTRDLLRQVRVNDEEIARLTEQINKLEERN